MLKHILVITILIVIILLMPALILVNNMIADSIRKELLAVPCPDDTYIVDSISIAGKLYGCGNGMQYAGAILIISPLEEEYLENYYRNQCLDCDIQRLTEFAFRDRFTKKADADLEYKPYVVSLIRERETGTIPDISLYRFLDLDFRAH